MRSLAAVAMLALVLTACGGEEGNGAAPAPATETVTVTAAAPTATPTSEVVERAPAPKRNVSVVGRVIFVEGVHMVSPKWKSVPRGEIVGIGKSACDAFDRGLTASEISAAENFDPVVAPYMPSVVVLAAIHICPEYETSVDKSNLKFAKPTKKPAKPKIPTSFGDGTYLVGEDVAPGTYRNDGDTYNGDAPCVAYTSTQPNDIASYISGSTTTGPGILVVNEGEYLSVRGCKTWAQ